MADITTFFGLRHLRGSPITHVRHLDHGNLVRAGTGQSFWFWPLNAALSEIPVDDRELPLLFHARTADFQDVTVQTTVTFRITDPALAASHIDFSIDPGSGRWRSTPLQQLGGLLTEAAQQHALDLLARTPLATTLVDGVSAVRDRVLAGLTGDPRLVETGLAVVGVRVVAIRPQADVEKALQTPTRERVQQEADRATFERRAMAVERERAIAENELQTQIELARREEQLVMQRGVNARRQAEETAAASAIETESQTTRERSLTQVRADGTRAMGEARAVAETAWLGAYRELNNATLLGLALRELAANLPKVQSLVLTPDLLAPILARLGTAPPANPTAVSTGERG